MRLVASLRGTGSRRFGAWRRWIGVPCLLFAATAGLAADSAPVADRAALAEAVAATERAFARAMADRSLEAFAGFIAEDAVFFSGPAPLRGRDAIVAYWARYFAGATAPFSWAPDQVEVLDDGSLAFSSGPVHDADGRLIGRFNSIWRKESPDVWRVVFDKGERVCQEPAS